MRTTVGVAVAVVAVAPSRSALVWGCRWRKLGVASARKRRPGRAVNGQSPVVAAAVAAATPAVRMAARRGGEERRQFLAA